MRSDLKVIGVVCIIILAVVSISGCEDDHSGGDTGDRSAEVPEPLCTAIIPAEAAAHGDYRALSYHTGDSIVAVSIANRGWRAVAGGWNGTIYAFDRSQATPRLTYQTDGPVVSVALSHDGRAFAAGTDYGGGCCPGGKLYYFECDQTTPTWIYDCARDEAEEGRANEGVKGVAISADGRWIAAISRYHLYLFRRDMVDPVLKLQLSTEASLATVAISADGSHMVVGTGPEADFTRSSVFYLDQHGLIWTSTITDLGWGPNNLPTPVAISADGSVIAAGGRDNRVHLWDNTSSIPRWTYKIAEQSPVSSIALSGDGTRLAATGNWTL